MFKRTFTSEDVRKYYNEWAERYENSYGNIIQAFRPANEEDLINYLIGSIGLEDGKHYLDAGCGVAGVAIQFAQKINSHISGITISDKQVEKAVTLIGEANLTKSIDVRQGDFHELGKIYDQHTFDGIYFLESLGHADDPIKVLENAYKVLKPGGFVYIKDFYTRESGQSDERKMIHRVIENINKHYKYNVMDLHAIISGIRKMDVKLNYIKSFDFDDDIKVRSDFETSNNIDLFEGRQEFMPADWYEIRFTKY